MTLVIFSKREAKKVSYTNTVHAYENGHLYVLKRTLNSTSHINAITPIL